MAEQDSNIPASIPSRLCRICQIPKPLDTFGPHRHVCHQCRYQQRLARREANPEFYATQQHKRREGERVRIAANPERQRARQRRWRHQDLERHNKKCREDYARNRSKRASAKKLARTNDPERFQAYRATHYYGDIEKSRAYQRQHYWIDPDRRRTQLRAAEQVRMVRDPIREMALRRVRKQRRQARKQRCPFLWDIVYEQWALEWWGFSCAYCDEPLMDGFWHRLSWDHFVPLSSDECPGTVPWNLLPSCGSVAIQGTGRDAPLCNSSKGAQDAHIWLQRLIVEQQERQRGRSCTKQELASIKGRVTRKLRKISRFFVEARAYVVQRGDLSDVG